MKSIKGTRSQSRARTSNSGLGTRGSGFWTSSFQVVRIIKQHRQLDAAMPELRKVLFLRIRRIKRRSRVIRRKQHQRVEERDQGALIASFQRGECIARVH